MSKTVFVGVLALILGVAAGISSASHNRQHSFCRLNRHDL
jgi:hypothetical protein